MGQSASQDQDTKIKNSIKTRIENDSKFRNEVLNTIKTNINDHQLTESISKCGGGSSVTQTTGQKINITDVAGKVTFEDIENIVKTNPITITCAAEMYATPQQKLEQISYMQQTGQIDQQTANNLTNAVNQGSSQGAGITQGLFAALSTGLGMSTSTIIPIAAIVLVVILFIILLK